MIAAVLIGLLLAIITWLVLGVALHLGIWAAIAALVVFLLCLFGGYGNRGGPVA